MAAAQSIDSPGIFQTTSADREMPQSAACAALAQMPWPTTAIARRAHLQRLESARTQCIRHAGLLAALGALCLEEGEPNQALIWLERALMLDPGSLGAQADMALALAALGEPTALSDLIKSWSARTDIPLALRNKLASVSGLSVAVSLPAVRLGRQKEAQWASHREATVLLGYESNLDHSPRLAEITLTPPDGPIDLALLNPLAPRRGMALLTDLSWQVARSQQAGQVWRAGISLGTRAAPTDRSTDWHHMQWAASGSQQWGPWRGQLELSGTWIAGPLSEPYRLLRVTASGDRNALGCMLRLAMEVETRTQSQTASADGRTVGIHWSNQCPLPGSEAWTWGAALRASVDQPASVVRPGGNQRLAGLGARLSGTLVHGIRLDASVKLSHVRDDDGYSPLLENNARRQLNQSQWSLELTKPIESAALVGAEGIVQLQGIRQTSNLSVFRYTGISGYTGLRWAW